MQESKNDPYVFCIYCRIEKVRQVKMDLKSKVE